MKKVAVFFAQGFEEIEALTVVDGCRRVGFETSMVSVEGTKTVTSSHGVEVVMDKMLSEMDFSDVDMLVLPGGMPGTKNLEKSETLMNLVDSFVKENRYVAAICAAPSILGHRNILSGKRACSYPGFEPDLLGAKVSNNPVEWDGKVITARGMGCAIDFTLAIVEALESKEAADKLAGSIIYR